MPALVATVDAWGDSVTQGGQASSEATCWQSVFLARLKKRFPKANIAEPPGSAHNFAEKVLTSPSSPMP